VPLKVNNLGAASCGGPCRRGRFDLLAFSVGEDRTRGLWIKVRQDRNSLIRKRDWETAEATKTLTATSRLSSSRVTPDKAMSSARVTAAATWSWQSRYRRARCILDCNGLLRTNAGSSRAPITAVLIVVSNPSPPPPGAVAAPKIAKTAIRKVSPDGRHRHQTN
jgi:hypothetical protein